MSDGGQVLSVLAADVSLSALRAMLSDATSLCEDSSYRYAVEQLAHCAIF